MASYYVDSAATGTASGADWTNAYLTLLAATAVATAADTIYIDDGHSEGGTTALSIVLPATVGLRILSVDKALGLAPTTVSAGASVSIASGAVALSINGCGYFYGVSILGSATASASSQVFVGNSTAGDNVLTFETCTLHARSGQGAAWLYFGPTASTGNDDGQITLVNTVVGVGHVLSSIGVRNCRVRGVGCSLTGSIPTSLFKTASGCTADAEFIGCDFSGLAYTNLVAGLTAINGIFRFAQCRLAVAGTAFTTTGTTVANTEVYIHDCHTDGTSGIFGYANALGSIITDSTIKFTGGAAGQSWKVTTTGSASFTSPFQTPWIDYYNTTLSALTPYVEVVRAGSATALNNDDLWIEVEAKVTAASTAATLSTDRRGLLAASAAQDTGTSSWDGSPATPWYGKLAVASLTPAATGHIRARVSVGIASVAGTIYVDPQIRT